MVLICHPIRTLLSPGENNRLGADNIDGVVNVPKGIPQIMQKRSQRLLPVRAITIISVIGISIKRRVLSKRVRIIRIDD